MVLHRQKRRQKHPNVLSVIAIITALAITVVADDVPTPIPSRNPKQTLTFAAI